MWDDHVWDLIDQAVERLEAAGPDTSTDVLAACLPEADDNTRRIVLTQLIMIDLERQWNQGKHPGIEFYLETWPDLASCDDMVAELLRAECRIRAEHGAPATGEELLHRFPEVAARIELFRNDSESQAFREGIDDPQSYGQLLASITMWRSSQKPHTASLMPGDHLGRYRIDSVLGRGGMGTVYLAHADELHRLVAVKLLNLDWLTSPEMTKQLLDEARKAAELQHETIVPVYDVGNENGTCFFVMEYVEGVSLAQQLTSQRVSVRQAASICLQVAEALEFAHRYGIVHCDVKPANILIDQRNRARLTDFGLAVRERHQMSGEIRGTLPYMSPEQIQPAIGRLDGRTDIWSLGVVMYELFTGCRPFDGRSWQEYSKAILFHEPRAPRRINRKISRELQWICLDCLQKHPLKRYATAAEVVTDLREATRPKSRRWRWIAGFVAIFFLLGAIGAAGEYWTRHPAEDSLDFSFSCNGGWLVCHDCSNCTGWYETRRIPSQVAQILAEIYRTNGSVISAGLNGEDQWLVIYERNGVRQRDSRNLPADMEAAIAKIDVEGGRLQDAALSPDGGWVVAYTQDGHTKWVYSGIPDGAAQMLNRLALSDIHLGGVGLAPHDGWIVVFRDPSDFCWRCCYGNLPQEVLFYLKEKRAALRLRHTEGTVSTVPVGIAPMGS